MSRSSLARALRSRRLAVWLLAGLTAWGVIGTGAPGAFSVPVFSAAMVLLALSTALCAWERTRYAWRVWRAGKRDLDPGDRRLMSRSALLVPVPAGSAAHAVARDVGDALRELGLRVRTSGRVLEGRAGQWGLLGSPLFHWALALLVIVIGAGRLTRAEGLLGIPVGESTPDVAESYLDREEGSLFGGYSELEIAVTGIEFNHVDGGVDRGTAPTVALVSEGGTLAEQQVFPNHPLKRGAITIHSDTYGLSPVVALLGPEGEEIGSVRPLLDFAEGASRTTTATIDLAAGQGSAFTLDVAAPLDAERPTLAMRFRDASGTILAEDEVPVGDALELPTGDRVRFSATGYFARLSVVHDWSVPYMYALFALAIVGISIAVLNPYRRVLVAVSEGAGGELAVRVSARHARRSVLFASRARAAVARAIGGDRAREGEGAGEGESGGGGEPDG